MDFTPMSERMTRLLALLKPYVKTQEAFATMAGCVSGQITHWKDGTNHTMKAATARRIRRYAAQRGIYLSLDWLIDGVGPEADPQHTPAEPATDAKVVPMRSAAERAIIARLESLFDQARSHPEDFAKLLTLVTSSIDGWELAYGVPRRPKRAAGDGADIPPSAPKGGRKRGDGK